MGAQLQELILRLKSGERKALSKAITLIESRHLQQKQQARELIKQLGSTSRSTLRLAISGSPGVGKSSFIETLGLFLLDLGLKPAVLTIDPSSHISGGSILGDRTRMEELSKRKEAFIRQSPSANFLGGVSRRTRETIIVCEQAGYDIILIETVGVGQSEYLAADLSDIFVLLVQPGAGDDLQGVKKGVMEMSDLLVVTKSDSNLESSARESARHLKNAIHILQTKNHGIPRKVMKVSSHQKLGFENFWKEVTTFEKQLKTSGQYDSRRSEQMEFWLRDIVDEMWLDLLHQDTETQSDLRKALLEVRSKPSRIYDAAQQIVDKRCKDL